MASGTAEAGGLPDRAQAKIVVERATKVYKTRGGEVLALDAVSAEVAAGEFVCILGPSGCGKTTLLWAMSGLHPLTSGRIWIDGTPVHGPRPDVGLIFQEANLLPWRTLLQNIAFPYEIRRRPPDRERIRELIAQVGLTGFEHRYPRELSGGMQQRASIVRALAQDPGILLMDEPFGALDAFTRDEMNLLIQRIWSEQKKTVVFVTHNIAEAVFLADRVFVLTPRPGRLARAFRVPLERPRTIEVTFQRAFVELVQEIRHTIDRAVQAQARQEVSASRGERTRR